MTHSEILSRCAEISCAKGHDYTVDMETDRFQNFRRSAELASWFADPLDKAFIVLIGTKLARLSALLSTGRVPKNESIEDSFVDLVNYCALWASCRTTPGDIK